MVDPWAIYLEISRFTYNGCSLVDYAVASGEMFNKIAQFRFHALTSLSDHCAINCSIMCFGIKVNHTTQTHLDPLRGKFVWNTESLDTYTEKIQSQDIRHKLHLFLNQEFDNCNKAVHAFSSLLCETASASTKFIKGHAQQRIPKAKKKPWFSDSCKDLHKVVKKYAKLVKMFPFYGTYRKEFYSYRSKFRRMCNTQKRKFRRNICNELFSNMMSDPKSFWGLINKLNKSRNDNIEEFDTQEFIQFYKNLNSALSSKNNEFHCYIRKNLKLLVKNIQIT